MWIVKNKNWNPITSEIEKFAIERILQRCDFTEVISNKYRTTNGYTQLKELIHYCEMSSKRSKTVKTLMVILEESKSQYLKQNIVSDYIIETYFTDLKQYIKDFEISKLLADKGQPNFVILQNLTHKLKIFEKQIDSTYFESLTFELKKINYLEKKEILRNVEDITKLIDLLIPYLVFNGYSVATIGEILRHWLKCNYHITISKFLSFFHFNTRPFSFFQYLGESNAESSDFLALMRNQLNVNVEEIRASELEPAFLIQNQISNEVIFAKYSYVALDPHKHVRSNFDSLLKKLVVQKERQSLAVFNNFFEHSFWSNKREQSLLRYKKIALEGDPINVNIRGRTLRNTLIKFAQIYSIDFTSNSHIPNVECEQLSNAIYYYNLALGSKSIENSLSLLWTALEAIQPYKVYGSDIEAVQAFLSKGLSIGALSRDIYSFSLRFIQSNQQNENCFDSLNTRQFQPIEGSKGLIEWFNWIRNNENCQSNFAVLKEISELLCFQYLSIGRPLIEQKQSIIFDRLQGSEYSIKYQLQRIYYHRNKIVHSGDMINEYTNLWMHLEWYVGKILAYFIIQLHYNKKYKSLEEAFMELEADHNYLCSYLEKNKDCPITELPKRIIEILFKHSWQAY